MVEPTQEELILGYLRYEIVRRLNPNEFTRLWRWSLDAGVPFDYLIDVLVEKEKDEMA